MYIGRGVREGLGLNGISRLGSARSVVVDSLLCKAPGSIYLHTFLAGAGCLTSSWLECRYVTDWLVG